MEKYIELAKQFYSRDIKKYHTLYHIINLFELYDLHKDKFLKEFPTLNEDTLFTAIAWHDCVYIPGCNLNEYLSAQAYYRTMKENPKFAECVETDFPAYSIILSTKIGNKIFDTPEKMVMHDLDWSGFCSYSLMLENEKKILYEAICDLRYSEKEVRKNQLNFYTTLIYSEYYFYNGIYLTETFKSLNCNEIAFENIKRRVKEMENEN